MTPIGNPKATMALQLEGQLGVFYDRMNTTRIPTSIELNLNNIRTAVNMTLRDVIQREIAKNLSLDVPSMEALTTEMANVLTNGTMVMIYLKLRKIHYFDQRYSSRFRIKPEVPDHFEIPAPYALAISQLGQIKISSLPTELYLAPGGPELYDTDFGIRANESWSPVSYARMVDAAKKIGLQFSTVDLSVKMGSSWWLYRTVQDNNSAYFECPYPEDNFTQNSATLATLFAIGDAGVYNPIVDQNALGTTSYGTMARSLPPDASLNTFYAIKVVN